MKILVIGSGGREHALAWALANSSKVTEVYVAPGNAGTASEAKVRNVDIAVNDADALVKFAKDNAVDLTVVGPEDPLVDGIVDRFGSEGLRCFGPSKGAAQLEGSKSYTKAFLKKYNIPTADYEVFESIEPALEYVRGRSAPIVVKADGLAAGKGVVVAQTVEEAEAAIKDMLSGSALGDAGLRVVIEEFLEGEEASFIVIADGNNFLPFASSQDHKAAFDADKGPNTGGMGAYSPAPVVTPEVDQRIVDEVIAPTIAGMQAEGFPFVGFLYAGLMIDKYGQPKVIEFNVRFGDPETQPIMSRLQSDLVDLIEAALDGQLADATISFDDRVALTVVLASGGYPGAYEKGKAITGLDSTKDAKVFHAGTRLAGGEVQTSGGRVLGVTALGDSVQEAQRKAYQAIESIKFDDMMFRTDIGYRAIAREQG